MTLRSKTIACLRWLLLGLAGTASLAAVLVTEENWRGDRAWAAVQREFEARGDRLDFETYVPATGPAAKNLFQTPLLVRIFSDEQGKGQARLLAALGLDQRVYAAITSTANSKAGGSLDFAAVRHTFLKEGLVQPPLSQQPAADVLRALGPLQPALQEMRRAARERPDEGFADQTLANHSINGTAAFGLIRILGFQVEVELQAGRPDDAWADEMVLLRITHGFTNHSVTLLQTMVGLAGFGINLAPLQEALRQEAWNEAQLAVVQQLLEDFHPLESVKRNMQLERAVVLYAADHDTPGTKALWSSSVLRGLAEQNKITFVRDATECFSSIDLSAQRLLLARVANVDQRMSIIAKSWSPYRSLERLALPTGFERIVSRGAAMANVVRQAVCAVALERYHLVHREYPMTLQDLVPGYLSSVPCDILDGQPVRYSRTQDGDFLLYTIGLDGRDHGGISSPAKGEASAACDRVWLHRARN